MFGIKMKQISSMKKILSEEDFNKCECIENAVVFQGEHYAYQIAFSSSKRYKMKVEVETLINEGIDLYVVKNAIVDNPLYGYKADDDYVTDKKGIMPDILIPLKENANTVCMDGVSSLWVDVNIPKDLKPGTYTVSVKFKNLSRCEQVELALAVNMKFQVLNGEIAPQNTMLTQWLHADCIASVHNVEIYSDEHWELIDRYMKMASDNGVTMIFTPILTLNLDVEFGVIRPNIQLVDITLDEYGYKFDFTKLKKWIALCKKNNFKYYELSHLFSQHGLKYASNVVADVNGEKNYIFGWNTSYDSERYAEFLKLFIPKIVEVLEEEKIKDVTYFHISDEPQLSNFESYKYAHDLIRPLIGDCKIFEAISNYELYEEGLIDIPAVCGMFPYLKEFIENRTENMFVYNSNICSMKVPNRFLSMPLHRNRALGIIMYKYSIKGLLHWGYNYYYSAGSEYIVNPFLTTSGDGYYPSGDPFSVYAGENGPVCSMRMKVFKDALQDIQLCEMLEKYIGKEEVVKFIEDMAGMEITFEEYPRNSEFYDNINKALKEKIVRFR